MSYPNTPGQQGPNPYDQTQLGPSAGGQYGAPGGQYGQPGYGAPGPGANYGGQYGAPYGQPAQGYPQGQQPQQAWGGGGGGLPPQTGSGRRKTILWITIGAAVLVVALVVTLVLVVTRDKGPGGSPQAAVQTYLEALAGGDAKKALSVMKTPPSEDLLTDEILKKQQDIAKITEIDVREPDTDTGTLAVVKATYRFGDRNADIDFRLNKSGDEWQIDDGAIALSVENLRIPQPTFFGVDISDETKIYVFPGPQDWGSANQNITAENSNGREFPLGPGAFSYVSLDAVLSPKGKSTVETAVNNYLTTCATSTQPRAATDKPGCSQSIFGAQAGTVRWTKPTDLSGLSYRLDYSDPSSVSVNGTVQWSATYVPTYSSSTSSTDTDYLSGKVDLSASTPTFDGS
ncbi:hypothetical protein GS4_26_01110 [Gordonia soli NBRC 108243]|uniref:DUF4878 domain-containing protein n=1 Tax=Gordonia soli NBRC 108243 TaxID=1223545 RepID=M0QM54_9ACTN|nr:hypothetical protein GS4_26_01110 [Gordonia soli NBRC 108243]